MVALVIAIAAILVLMNRETSSTAGSGGGKAGSPVASGNYLPLAKGNTWEYERTVSDSKRVCSWQHELHIMPGGMTMVYSTRGFGLMVEDPPKRSTERYSVTGQEKAGDDSFWVIDVKGECPRDGRYYRHGTPAEKVLWGRLSAKGPRGSSMTFFQERVHYGMDYDSFSGPRYSREHHATMLIIPDLPGSSLSMNVEPAEVACLGTTESVKVPAGTFNNCLVMLTTLPPEGIGDLRDRMPKLPAGMEVPPPKENDFTRGWTTKTYFARGVGMVKEVQVSWDGRETYRLELKKYNIAGGN